jgi:lipid-A-disaccharide synthase
MAKYDIVLVANSPGELSALVKPVAMETAKVCPEARITLVLTPCQYTSGRELEYVNTIKEIINTVTAQSYQAWILKNQKPAIDFSKHGVVLYLGGDLAYAVLVAKKLKYPCFAYVQDRIGWTGTYQGFFVPDEQCRRKLGRTNKIKQKISIVGNLMVDSVSDQPKWRPEINVITFMPGSRQWQIKHMTPIYEEIIQLLKKQYPTVKVQIVSSPFQPAMAIVGVKTIPFEEVINSELVVTIPGTNTARLAALGMPMLSLFPLDNPQVIPLEGIPHYISMIPVIGPWFKKTLVETLNRKTKYFVLPNIKANQEIVPEIRGIIEPVVVVQKIMTLLKDKPLREKMSQQLLEIMGPPGAARKIAERLNETLHTLI